MSLSQLQFIGCYNVSTSFHVAPGANGRMALTRPYGVTVKTRNDQQEIIMNLETTISQAEHCIILVDKSWSVHVDVFLAYHYHSAKMEYKHVMKALYVNIFDLKLL